MQQEIQGSSGEGPWNLGLKLLGEVKGKQVLDLASGGGRFAHELTKRGAEPRGCDILDQWQFPEIPFEVVDIDEPLPFRDASFDAVTIIEALNYVGSASRLFREAYRILRPGGVFVATFPNCLCLESRVRFLLNGTYRWFPHPIFRGGEKENYADFGRDPLRISTAAFQAQEAGFSVEEIAFGSSRLGAQAVAAALPLMWVTRAHNRFRSNQQKRVPDFASGLDASLYRNVGFRCTKRR